MLHKAWQPFQTEPLKHRVGTLDPPDVKIKDRADGAGKANVQPMAVGVDPLFLLGRGHSHPEHIGGGGVDRLAHGDEFSLRVVCFKRWRIGTGNADIRIIHGHFPPYGGQGVLRGTEKKHRAPPCPVHAPVQPFEDIGACDPRADTAPQHTGAQQNTGAVGDQPIGTVQCLGKRRVGFGNRIGMGIEAGQPAATLGGLPTGKNGGEQAIRERLGVAVVHPVTEQDVLHDADTSRALATFAMAAL